MLGLAKKEQSLESTIVDASFTPIVARPKSAASLEHPESVLSLPLRLEDPACTSPVASVTITCGQRQLPRLHSLIIAGDPLGCLETQGVCRAHPGPSLNTYLILFIKAIMFILGT